MPSGSYALSTTRFGLGARVLSISMVWAIELIALSVWLDTRDLSQGRFLTLLGNWGPGILRALVTTAAICLAFGYTQLEKIAPRVAQIDAAPISWVSLTSICLICLNTYSGVSLRSRCSR